MERNTERTAELEEMTVLRSQLQVTAAAPAERIDDVRSRQKQLTPRAMHRPLTRFVHFERPALDIRAVEPVDGRLTFFV